MVCADTATTTFTRIDTAAPAATRPRVLIIHSDPKMRDLLRWLLHLHVAEVAATAGGGDALALAREWHPSVAVMDLRLDGPPGGYLLLRWLREIDPHLPVLVYTDPTTAKRARDVTQVITQGEHRLPDLLTAVQAAHAARRASEQGT